MSYRLDSEFSWFYGTTTNISTGERVAPAIDIKWKQPDDSFQGRKIMKNRNKDNKCLTRLTLLKSSLKARLRFFKALLKSLVPRAFGKLFFIFKAFSLK
jgi:hypothetical protein